MLFIYTVFLFKSSPSLLGESNALRNLTAEAWVNCAKMSFSECTIKPRFRRSELTHLLAALTLMTCYTSQHAHALCALNSVSVFEYSAIVDDEARHTLVILSVCFSLNQRLCRT